MLYRHLKGTSAVKVTGLGHSPTPHAYVESLIACVLHALPP